MRVIQFSIFGLDVYQGEIIPFIVTVVPLGFIGWILIRTVT